MDQHFNNIGLTSRVCWGVSFHCRYNAWEYILQQQYLQSRNESVLCIVNPYKTHSIMGGILHALSLISQLEKATFLNMTCE